MKAFHKHTWGKWSEPIDTAHSHVKVQSRYCSECNKCQVKKVKQPWNILFSASQILKKASFNCNGFCGEYECKENQTNCKRLKKASEK